MVLRSRLSKILAWGAVAGVAVGTWKVSNALQQRRRAQRRQMDALRNREHRKEALRTYLTLHAEFRGDADKLEELRTAFDPEWLPDLRMYLGRQLGTRQFDQACDWVIQMEWEWRQAAGEHAFYAIRALVEYLRRPVPQPSADVLRRIVKGFRAVGLGATQPVVDWLQGVQPEPGVLRAALFRESGAAGRYLLAKWGEQNTEIASLLRRWEQEARLPVYNPGSAGQLWPSTRGESRLMGEGVRRLGLDLNPFGPEKAEQDPLLPDLFYRVSPLWDELVAPQPSVLVAAPGSGRSALIWMLRHECGLAGSRVEGAFPVYVPIHAFSSPEALEATVHEAAAMALCQVLAHDPYGLLGLDDAVQQELVCLLLRSAGGLAPLLRCLRVKGLPAGDPDAQLLQEALTLEARSPQLWADGGDGYVPQFHPYGRLHTFLLFDVSLTDTGQLQSLVDLLLDRWSISWTSQKLVPKVFLPFAPRSCSMASLQIRWDADTLRRLLWHRLERAGLILPADGSALRGWVEGVDDPDRALLEAAGGSPAQLVRLGNRLIRRLSQPQLLGKQEYLELIQDRNLS